MNYDSTTLCVVKSFIKVRPGFYTEDFKTDLKNGMEFKACQKPCVPFSLPMTTLSFVFNFRQMILWLYFGILFICRVLDSDLRAKGEWMVMM